MSEFQDINLEDHAVEMLADVQLVPHRTPESIALAFWQMGDDTLTLEDCETVGGLDAEGNETEVPFSNWMEGLVGNGFWGFVSAEKREVHIWPGSASDEVLLMLLGHELGHLVVTPRAPEGKAVLPWQKVLAEAIEEGCADTYGAVALQAFRFWQQIKALTAPPSPEEEAWVAEVAARAKR